jgi:hypothetical protein
LPAPGDLFLEIQTAKLHGGWGAWSRLPVEERAKLLAHELHLKMREHYEYDVRSPADKPDAKASAREGRGPWSDMRKQFFGGGHNIANEK